MILPNLDKKDFLTGEGDLERTGDGDLERTGEDGDMGGDDSGVDTRGDIARG